MSGSMNDTAYTKQTTSGRGSGLEPVGLSRGAPATHDEVASAIERLSDADLLRLEKAASILLGGTEYSSPRELLNEALARTLQGGLGPEGRHWPQGVPFTIFVKNAMKSIADTSRHSSHKTEEVLAGDLVNPDSVEGDPIEIFTGGIPAVEDQAIALEARQAKEKQNAADLAALDKHFSHDEQVNWIMMGIQDGISASEIQGLSGMTPTQYETAHKRFRRGLEKLFPGRRKPWRT